MSHFIVRSKQFLLAKVLGHLPNKQDLQFGSGVHRKLPELIEKAGHQSIFVMITAGMLKRGTLTPLLEDFEQRQIKVTTFTDIQPDPSLANVLAAKQAYQKANSQALVAIGGGSVLDCAKIAGACISNPQFDPTAPSFLKHDLPDFYALATTAGSGSEVTAGAVITFEHEGSHRKIPINDLRLVPKTVLLDPDLTLTLPQSLTISSGMDAISHVVEAASNRFASKKTLKAAKTALPLLARALPKVVAKGEDIEARQDMLLGSYQAGIAITTNFVGYVHALSHAIGGRYGLTHGILNTQLMPVVLKHYGSSAHPQLAQMADWLSLADGHSRADKADAFLTWLDDLRQQFSIPKTIKELTPADYDLIADQALKEANPTYPVPVIWEKSDIIAVLKELTDKV